MFRPSSCILFALMLVSATGVFADEAKDALRAVEKEFNSQPRRVRADHPMLAVNYVELDGEVFAYHPSIRFMRLARDDKEFQIRKIKRKREYVEAQFKVIGSESSVLKIKFRDNGKLSESFQTEVFPMMLRDLFEFRDALFVSRYIANTASGALHLATCNHLPVEEDRAKFRLREEGEAQGFRACPACFSDAELLPIPAYPTRRRAAIESARFTEMIYPPIEDSTIQARIQQIGDSLLAAYPFDLKGYEYSFKVLHSNYANAFAHDTGFVYVTDTAYHSAESDAELAFMLAHEIAHVEMDLLSDPEDRRLNEQDLLLLYADRRQSESSSDWIALQCVWGLYGRDAALQGTRAALLKLAFGTGESLTAKSGPWDTRPTIGERLLAMVPDQLKFLNERLRFCGMNGDGDIAISLQPILVGRAGDASYILFAAEPSDLMNDEVWVRHRVRAARMTDGAEKRFFAGAAQAIRLVPGAPLLFRLNLTHSTATTFSMSKDAFEQFDVSGFSDFTMDGLDEIKSWVACDD